MNSLKVHLMHAEVSAALERLSKLFKPGMKITFIARLPGNGEADVLIGDDYDEDELIALVRRRFGASTEGAQKAPEDVRNQDWAKWIVQRGLDMPDHACAECVPHGDIIKPGFQCVYHQALALRTSSTDQANADTGSAA